MPYIKTEMSVSDIEKLIDGIETYANEDCRYWHMDFTYEEELDQLVDWCPLHWAVHYENFEFVQAMIRTPFDFNKLKFTLTDNLLDPDCAR